MLNSKAKWIWINKNPQPEEYACFKENFSIAGNQRVTLKISAETDYIACINGTMVAFSQFPGYPFEKYYDETDISSYCKEGKNELLVTVRYEGAKKTATHIEDGAGVIFSIEEDKKTVAFSSEDTSCGYDNRYIQHHVRTITPQLGFSSGIKTGEPDFDKNAVEICKTCKLSKTPVDKLQFVNFEKAKHIGNNIYDLGRETAGYLNIKVKSDCPCDFKVGYGEHLHDGCVRSVITNTYSPLDFRLDFHSGEGEHEFTQYFVRIAGRYLQVEAPDYLEILSIGVYHYLYPLTETAFNVANEDKQIYETCVRTLRLCMNHHYEDCPWREQALYILDSRNQMLCGYYAFEETKFQRENILFMAKGVREDGFFELTFPAVNTPSIPFFSIMYPVLVNEYIEHTNDTDILDEVMGKIITVMEKTKKRISEKSLIPDFEQPYWNFYEWSDGSDGGDEKYNSLPQKDKYHLILNCAFVYAGESYKKLCNIGNIACDIDFDSVKKAIKKEFFNEETGLFANTLQKDKYSQLGNAFALLIGLGDERTANALKENSALIPATLSMLGFVYDALLKADPAKNISYILDDIRQKYSYMLEHRATSFWETIVGEEDFDGAGSLCHGWSAIPIYYYNILKENL